MLKSRLFLSRSLLLRQKLLYCTNQTTELDEEKEREIERIKKNASIEEPPTACCQSGCANCVFIVWAETLASKMNNAGPEIAEKIMKTVDDPSMRAYLELELRIRGLKKE
ncbi:oxidoreductase-like domain-containing protein 1 isoform X2 [Bicyclus anynana]|uniref:Oxidoreductase-like domain-containing protein 1 isoform X2 n=1 Tax=Bicyclus anynana TaxID=110368 RepID=A0ABM3LM55_BICAN|nr:oxidoreductase-like domain-containing protein 1 isoform X2 [Bicyclus anynana]